MVGDGDMGRQGGSAPYAQLESKRETKNMPVDKQSGYPDFRALDGRDRENGECRGGARIQSVLAMATMEIAAEGRQIFVT